MQRIDNIGWQALVKQKSENVVAVMSSSLKSYFYFVIWTCAAVNLLQQGIKSICIIGNGEYTRKGFPFRIQDNAIMLILGNINTHTNHNEYLRYVYLMPVPQNTLLL